MEQYLKVFISAIVLMALLLLFIVAHFVKLRKKLAEKESELRRIKEQKDIEDQKQQMLIDKLEKVIKTQDKVIENQDDEIEKYRNLNDE